MIKKENLIRYFNWRFFFIDEIYFIFLIESCLFFICKGNVIISCNDILDVSNDNKFLNKLFFSNF